MRFLCLILLSASTLAAPPVVHSLGERHHVVRDELFVACVDSVYRMPVWCCYTVTAESQSGSGESRNFHTLLPDASLERSDYAGSGYDIGHLAPLGSFDADPEVSDVNCLENCCPQRPGLNRGPWLKLEERERQLAVEHGAVNVTVTLIFRGTMPTLPNADETHIVPSHLRKQIEWTGSDGKVHRESYTFPQDCGRSDPLENFREE